MRIYKEILPDDYFGDKSLLLNRLVIFWEEKYDMHLNNHNVVYIDFSRAPENCIRYQAYILRITHGIMSDVLNEFFD